MLVIFKFFHEKLGHTCSGLFILYSLYEHPLRFLESSCRPVWVFFPGYDIKSFNEDGEEIFIEVKSTVSKGKNHFEISDNEVLAAESLEGSYFIYQVTDALANPKISAIVRNPMKYVEQKKMLLEPWIYKMFI